MCGNPNGYRLLIVGAAQIRWERVWRPTTHHHHYHYHLRARYPHLPLQTQSRLFYQDHQYY